MPCPQKNAGGMHSWKKPVLLSQAVEMDHAWLHPFVALKEKIFIHYFVRIS
jgi:hypothetical protein